MDIRQLLRTSPMTRYQWAVVAICLFAVAVDGFDVFAMGFVLPRLPHGFVDSDRARGFLLSCGLAGMATGSFLLAPIADRVGRRRLVICALTVTLVGVVGSAAAGDVQVLIAARAITGFGIGGLVPSLVVIVQEYSSDQRRGLVTGIYLTGMPLGALVGGAIGASVVTLCGGSWRAIFVVGVALTGLALSAIVIWVPESVDYLYSVGTKTARARIVAIATRLGIEADRTGAHGALAAAPLDPPPAGLFAAGAWRTTVLLSVTQAMLMAAWYFLNTWTPQLVKVSSGSTGQATAAGLLLSLGGVIGSVLLGAATLRYRLSGVLWTTAVAAAVIIAGFAALFTVPTVAIVLTAAVGMAVNCAVTAVAVATPMAYPVRSRSAGTGWVLGVGRLGSIVAPILVGYLLAVFSPQSIYFLTALPVMVAAATGLALRPVLDGADRRVGPASSPVVGLQLTSSERNCTARPR
ncbi:MFS transporter [Nocardia sp. NEAU-G5]|uniref:MFS transporter n=1 Tax=Nocardia albiluteola TaxID=2842303 RepID=A0ABS6BBV9_9NOCA|nr:MFS transporter [Nocardia albiluteola]MBU3067764.1 MFS transporter [Nocardia albiluteola]